MAESLHPTGLEIKSLYVISEGSPWVAEECDRVIMSDQGFVGDRHAGHERHIRRYESSELAGLAIKNDKQISFVADTDMQAIAADIELPAREIEEKSGDSIEQFMARQLAANILLKASGHGLNNVLAPGATLVFGDSAPHISRPTIRITEYNNPCRQPVTQIIRSFSEFGINDSRTQKELGAQFMEVAAARRGWVGWVLSPGTLAVGQAVHIHVPVLPPGNK